MTKISIIPWIAKKLKRCIGIVEDTDIASQAIASDKYVIWKGDVCKSIDDISEGDTLSPNNLSPVTNGIGNDLLEDVTANTQAIAKLPEIKIVRYTTSADIAVPANGMKEIGTALSVLGDASAFVITGLIIANGYEKIIIGMNRYGSTIYAVARNIDGTAKTIASGTTINFITYKEI